MSAPAPAAAAAAAPAATPVADTKTETKALETKGTTTVVAAVATTWKPLVVGEQHVDDAYAEVHRLNKRVMELQRRLNKAENKAKAERAGWAPFGWRILNPHSIVSLSNGGKTATNKHGGGLLETIVGDAVFEKSVHSFRVHIEKGDNLFIGLVSAPVEGKAAEEAHPGTDYAIRDSRPKRAQFAQFVGESNGVGLNTQHGCVYVNGRMHFLGDFAVCKPGDDVGVHVNVDKHHVQFFKNGAALGRLVQLPAHPGNLVAAVSLVNLDDKVTLNFRHPEDEWAA